MIALVRYGLASMRHAQRYLAPLLLYLAVLGVATSNDSGPLLPEYAVAAAALFVCATWLTMALLSVEDPVHHAISVVNAGSAARVLVAWSCVALVNCLGLEVLGLVFPMVNGQHQITGAGVLVGAESLLACALAGIGVGLICSRLVFRRPGYALVTAVGLVLVLTLVRDVPPINLLFRLLANATAPSTVVVPVTVLLAASVVLLAVCATLTHLIATRRD